MNIKPWLDISPEVQDALDQSLPIVALESTIISHGMPYPKNLETAQQVENIIRAQGVVPATIGIVGGKIKIGLTAEELAAFAQDQNVHKVSRRDLPVVLSQKWNGATTVAATMICAELAGIAVFVTGGIGGVHRNAETTMDISADLLELAQTNVAVICAGVKSILDIPKTLEVLETNGVPVIGYQTEDFPAFYTRSSQCNVQFRLDTPEAIAQAMDAKWKMGLKGGVVIGNPIPESDAIDEDQIAQAIGKALDEAQENGIIGKEVTPFLLDRIQQLTDGKSLETNIALVYNNAKVGAQIAEAFNQIAPPSHPS